MLLYNRKIVIDDQTLCSIVTHVQVFNNVFYRYCESVLSRKTHEVLQNAKSKNENTFPSIFWLPSLFLIALIHDKL